MTSNILKLTSQHSIINQADTLAQRHSSYVDQFVTRANDELYAILADIMALYEKVKNSSDHEKMIKHIRKHLREEHGIKTQANTRTTALITKLVTRANRKTAHVYSRVLESAEAHSISSTNLAEWIKSKGGIDKVRVTLHSQETVAQQKALEKQMQTALREKLTVTSTVGVVKFAGGSSLPLASDVSFTHLLCQFNHSTGQHEIVSVMYPSSALETKALEEHLLMLSVAAVSDDDQKFGATCKKNGLNMDIILRWMHANNIADASTARIIKRSLKPREIHALQMAA